MNSTNRMRARAKARMPMVLLTRLSIVQALAMELLWGHEFAGRDLDDFFCWICGWA